MLDLVALYARSKERDGRFQRYKAPQKGENVFFGLCTPTSRFSALRMAKYSKLAKNHLAIVYNMTSFDQEKRASEDG